MGFSNFWKRFRNNYNRMSGKSSKSAAKSNISAKRNHIYKTFINTLGIDDNLVLLESYHGNAMRGNVYALFKEMIQNPQYSHMKFVWVINERELFTPITDLYSMYPNVQYVSMYSPEYFKALATAKYLFNDNTFLKFFAKREGQIYTNTWHGTPLKAMGYDMQSAKGFFEIQPNLQRNLFMADFILNENRFTTEVFLNSIRLNNVFEGKFIEEGYPRADLTLNSDKETIFSRLKKLGLNVSNNKKTLLFAPTFRGASDDVVNTMPQIWEEFNVVRNTLGDEYNILLKVHPILYSKFVRPNAAYKKIVVPDIFDTNEILSITDLVITDYSSIFVDFMSTRKPIVFYMSDLHEYVEGRGELYIPLGELPGPVYTAIKDVVKGIMAEDYLAQNFQDNYDRLHKLWCYANDGNSATRVLDIIINNNTDGYNVYPIDTSSKKKLLFYAGNMITNGITSSFLALLHSLDKDKYDISILLEGISKKTSPQVLANIAKIPAELRVIFRVGEFLSTSDELKLHKKIISIEDTLLNKENIDESVYELERRRLFGDIQFDFIIDFCGYSLNNMVLLSTSFKNSEKILFLHNDIEAERVSRFPHMSKFYPMYKKFQNIASVSAPVMEVNRENLYIYAPKSNWTVMSNFINIDYIQAKADPAGDDCISIGNDKFLLKKIEKETRLTKTVGLLKLPVQNGAHFTFVGRLTKEKGVDLIINAFATIQAEFPHAKLSMVGYGPMDAELKAQIKKLNISNSVYMIGALDNPWLYLNHSDCMVMASQYEGQGLVALEALLLGKPVISTDIPSVREILEDGKYGTLVERGISGLATAMRNFIENRPVFPKFDMEKYNQIITNQWDKVIDNQKH